MAEVQDVPLTLRTDLERASGFALQGLNWRIASSALRLLVQLMVLMVLAHILPPRDFGLLGLAVIVTGVAATFSEIGVGPALVQRVILTHVHMRVGFTLSLIAGALATAILWTLAPAAAVLLRNAETVPLICFVSLTLLFESAGVVSRSLLLRRLDFKREFWAEACANLVGYAAVSIGLALLRYGVWALAAGLLARAFVRSAVLHLMAPHPMGLLLARREASEMLRFGLGVSLTRLANYAASNADYIVVGAWLGAEALGLYQNAYQIGNFAVSCLTVELSYVLFPVFAASSGEPRRLHSLYRGALVLVVLIALPSTVAIAISAPELVPVILGDRWAGSILPLQILCIGGVFHAAYNLSDALARASGAVYRQAVRHLIYAAAVFAGSMLGLPWDLVGVSTGVVAAIVLICILMFQLSIRLVGSSWLKIIKMHIPGALVALAVGAGGIAGSELGRRFELPHVASLVLILVSCAVGALVALIGIPTRWLGSDIIAMLVDVAYLIPYDGIRKCILRKVEEADTVGHRWRVTIKEWARPIPGLRRAYQESRLLVYAIREGLWRAALSSRRRGRTGSLQAVLTWDVLLPPVTSPSELANWLRQQGVTSVGGWHTLYLPPQERLEAILGDWISRYPPDAGFKILKDFRPPEEAYYVDRSSCGSVEASLTGTPLDQLITANFLYANNLSPRVYDLCCLRSGSNRFSAFVVQHVDGRVPTEEGCQQFLSRLREVTEHTDLKVTHPAWWTTIDSQPPDCNGNLLVPRDSDHPLYIDFQTFRLVNASRWRQEILAAGTKVLHFGDEHPQCGNRYLYQSGLGIPDRGKRNIDKRWAVISEHLECNGLNMSGRLVLDVGCNAGMMIAAALSDGALWGIGWDLPSVVTYAEPLLLSLGLTRFNLVPVKLHRGYPLQDDIPDHLRHCLEESVILFLAVRQHIGLMECLQQMPWRIFIYEGHEGERLEDLEDYIRPLLRQHSRVVSRAYIADGFSGRRPFAILLKL